MTKHRMTEEMTEIRTLKSWTRDIREFRHSSFVISHFIHSDERE